MNEDLQKFRKNYDDLIKLKGYRGNQLENASKICYAEKYGGYNRPAGSYHTYGIDKNKNSASKILIRGKIKNVLFWEHINVTSEEYIIKLLEISSDAYGWRWEKDENLFYLYVDNDDGTTDKYCGALNHKGSLKLTSYVDIYGIKDESKIDYSGDAIEVWDYLGFNDMFRHFFLNTVFLVKITNLEKVTDIKNPETLKKIYTDINPIFSEYFLNEFSINNIYYDNLQKKYVILGIVDYISYEFDDEITTDFNSFLNGDLLYRFKKTGKGVTFDDYLIFRYGFPKLKKEWEVL